MPKFPFTNYHELNLDWILKKVNALFDASEENARTIRTYDTRLNSAEQTATSAATAATAAQQLADAASENADSALSVAGTADSKADSALTAATNAAGAVAGALTTAQEAQQTAAAAVATANDAAATASSLESLANTANQNATAALETAQTADQKAVAALETAQTADQKAVAAQTAATTNAGNISTLQTDVSNLNRQTSDLRSTVDDLVLEKTITNDSIGRVTVDYPIHVGDLIQLTNTAPSNGNDVSFRAQGSSDNLQMVFVPANSTITVVSTVNADCLSPYFQVASSIIAKTLNKRVPVLEDEMQESVKSLDNVQERITAIDLHPYIPFEIGYMSSDDNGFIYSDMDTRVRTKRGFTIELKTGDKVGLNDYTGVRYILFRYDYTTETYKSSGWLTTSWIVENSTEGLYGIMLAYNPDKTVTDITELTKLFYINKQVDVGTPLRVMSFNLGHFAYGQVGIGTTYKWGIADSIYTDRLKNWESFFIKYNADLLCTQEYSRCLDRVPDGETDASGTKITDTIIFDKLYSNKMVCQTNGNVFVDNRSFTNCTLLDSTSVQIGSNGLYCTYSHISIDNKTIALVNLHLSTTAEKRLSEFRAIKTLLQNEKYAIICGDFNTQDQAELSIFSQGNYKVINGGTNARRYTTNSTIAYYCTQDETAKISWYDFDKRVYQRETREQAIDNIIVTQNIDVLDFMVCGDDFENLTSDHCAIFAELSIN